MASGCHTISRSSTGERGKWGTEREWGGESVHQVRAMSVHWLEGEAPRHQGRVLMSLPLLGHQPSKPARVERGPAAKCGLSRVPRQLTVPAPRGGRRPRRMLSGQLPAPASHPSLSSRRRACGLWAGGWLAGRVASQGEEGLAGPTCLCAAQEGAELAAAPALERPPMAARPLTFLQHPHFEAFHEAAGLAGLAPPLGDLALVGGRAAVLDVPCNQTQRGLPGVRPAGPTCGRAGGWAAPGRSCSSPPQGPTGRPPHSRCSALTASNSLPSRDPRRGPGSHLQSHSPRCGRPSFTGAGHPNSLGCHFIPGGE